MSFNSSIKIDARNLQLGHEIVSRQSTVRYTNLDSERYWRGALCLPVTLEDETTKGAPGEREHVPRQWRRTNQHHPQPAAHRVLDLLEYDFVPYAVFPHNTLFNFRFLRSHTHIEDHLLQE